LKNFQGKNRMKRIDKKEPDFYHETLFKSKPEKWEDLPNRSELRIYMITYEQNFQCAYTEVRIEPESSHVDHYIKQSFILQGLFKPLTIFSWENLFTSCNSDYFGAKYKDKNIKPADYEPLLNPAMESYANHFKYSWTGEILVEENDIKGFHTIRLFNLNDPVLVEQRKVVAFQVKTMYNQFSLEEMIGIIGKFESMIGYFYHQLESN